VEFAPPQTGDSGTPESWIGRNQRVPYLQFTLPWPCSSHFEVVSLPSRGQGQRFSGHCPWNPRHLRDRGRHSTQPWITLRTSLSRPSSRPDTADRPWSISLCPGRTKRQRPKQPALRTVKIMVQKSVNRHTVHTLNSTFTLFLKLKIIINKIDKNR